MVINLRSYPSFYHLWGLLGLSLPAGSILRFFTVCEQYNVLGFLFSRCTVLLASINLAMKIFFSFSVRYLGIYKRIIGSLSSQQLGMSPLFNDPPVLNDCDDVRILYGREPMCNHHTCPSLPGIIQGLLHNL